jgi:hypothetical protein
MNFRSHDRCAAAFQGDADAHDLRLSPFRVQGLRDEKAQQVSNRADRMSHRARQCQEEHRSVAQAAGAAERGFDGPVDRLDEAGAHVMIATGGDGVDGLRQEVAEPLRLRQPLPPLRPQVFRKAGDLAGGTRPAADEGDRSADDVVLACAACQTPITSRSARTTVAGSFEHVGVNPHGYAFRIGCFARAVNVAASGPPTEFWSWFPGYAWQVETCARCRAHLGWLFQSVDHRFHGLVLDRLVEVERGAGRAVP